VSKENIKIEAMSSCTLQSLLQPRGVTRRDNYCSEVKKTKFGMAMKIP